MNTLNTDDIFLRNLTISLLDLLNSEMHLTISRADHKEKFSVPFLYNFATDEGFLKDFYVGLPDNCEILAGSPIFTHNLETGVGIVAMISQHHPCSKNNRVSVVRSTDIGSEIKKITNCVSYYFNLPGYIDNIGKCNFYHHS